MISLVYFCHQREAIEVGKVIPLMAEQSTTFNTKFAKYAIDGKTSSVSHSERNSWVRIHFDKIIYPSKIVVINGKRDKNLIWLNDAEVFIYTSNTSKQHKQAL